MPERRGGEEERHEEETENTKGKLEKTLSHLNVRESPKG